MWERRLHSTVQESHLFVRLLCICLCKVYWGKQLKWHTDSCSQTYPSETELSHLKVLRPLPHVQSVFPEAHIYYCAWLSLLVSNVSLFSAWLHFMTTAQTFLLFLTNLFHLCTLYPKVWHNTSLSVAQLLQNLQTILLRFQCFDIVLLIIYC